MKLDLCLSFCVVIPEMSGFPNDVYSQAPFIHCLSIWPVNTITNFVFSFVCDVKSRNDELGACGLILLKNIDIFSQ